MLDESQTKSIRSVEENGKSKPQELEGREVGGEKVLPQRVWQAEEREKKTLDGFQLHLGQELHAKCVECLPAPSLVRPQMLPRRLCGGLSPRRARCGVAQTCRELARSEFMSI